MTRHSYSFPLGLGVDAELTLECEDGTQLSPQHITMLSRYLRTVAEAIGGTWDEEPAAPQRKPRKDKGTPRDAAKCPECQDYFISAKHKAQCMTVPVEQDMTPVDALYQENGSSPQPVRPFVDAQGRLNVDSGHEDVIWSGKTRRWLVYFMEPESHHQHQYETTTADADLADEVQAVCKTCQKTIQIIEPEMVALV